MASVQHKTLILACGALAKEIIALKRMLLISGNGAAGNGADGNGVGAAIDVQCLPADFHNTPDKIVPGLAAILDARGQNYDRILIGYGDCGTGGGLDRLLENYPHAERMPGAHCYEFFAGASLFADMMEEELGSFFLTDYLVRHFDRIIMKGLGLDRFPHLTEVYFKNYKRLIYVSQTKDAELVAKSARAAEQLGLTFVHRHVGYGDLAVAIEALGRQNSATKKEEHYVH